MKRSLYGLLFVAGLGAQTVHGGEALPLVADETTEKRMLAISSELRCLVCQNESLAGSNAELASDLRREIRALIKEGKSDEEIMDFMVSRYGNFVRYRPPLQGTTVLLWFGPGVLFIVGLTALIRHLRRRERATADVSLTAEERRRAQALLQDSESHQERP